MGPAATRPPGEVRCRIAGCGRTWARDPVLEVPCPVCGAGVGSRCVSRRPSEHALSQAFAGLPPWGHDERELAADAAGAYGPCPLGGCGRAPGSTAAPPAGGAQLSLL